MDAGSHPGVITAIYNVIVMRRTYVDARTAIEEDNPDVMDKVLVLEVSDPIPNDGVQFHPDFPAEMRDQIVAALIKMSETDEGKEALQTAYSWNALEPQDDSFYDGSGRFWKSPALILRTYAPEINR